MVVAVVVVIVIIIVIVDVAVVNCFRMRNLTNDPIKMMAKPFTGPSR